MGYLTRTKYRDNEQLSAIIEVLDERDNLLDTRLDKQEDRINNKLEGYMAKEEAKMDKIITGFSHIEKEMGTLSATVASNHASAMTSISEKKHEIREEASDKYATKVELSSGLNSLRTTAKVIWFVVIAVGGLASWLSSKGIL